MDWYSKFKLFQYNSRKKKKTNWIKLAWVWANPDLSPKETKDRCCHYHLRLLVSVTLVACFVSFIIVLVHCNSSVTMATSGKTHTRERWGSTSSEWRSKVKLVPPGGMFSTTDCTGGPTYWSPCSHCTYPHCNEGPGITMALGSPLALARRK